MSSNNDSHSFSSFYDVYPFCKDGADSHKEAIEMGQSASTSLQTKQATAPARRGCRRLFVCLLAPLQSLSHLCPQRRGSLHDGRTRLRHGATWSLWLRQQIRWIPHRCCGAERWNRAGVAVLLLLLLLLLSVALWQSERNRNGSFHFSYMSCSADREKTVREEDNDGAALRAAPLPDYLRVSYLCPTWPSLCCALWQGLVRLVEHVRGQPPRRGETLASFLRFRRAYNRLLEQDAVRQGLSSASPAQRHTLPFPFDRPNSSGGSEAPNLHFSCEALRAMAGWLPSDVLPQARQYLRRYARFAIVTGADRPRHLSARAPGAEPAPDGATDHLRVRLMDCLWMHALAGDNIVQILTDDNRSLAAIAPGRDLRRHSWQEMKDEVVALHVQQGRLLQHAKPRWMLAQFRFFDAIDVLHEAMWRQAELRWAIVLDDDTHVQLNRLASLLHRRQLGYLFLSPVIPWREAAPELHAAWQALCQSLTAAEREAADAPRTHEPCAALPRAMAELHAALRQRAGGGKPLEALLTWLTDLSAMQRDAPRAALWAQSQRLLPPWVLARLLPSLYLSTQPFGGTGHYLGRGAVAAVHHNRSRCLQHLTEDHEASDEALWRCLPHPLAGDASARHLRRRGSYERRLRRAWQNKKRVLPRVNDSGVVALKEMDLFMWDYDVRFLRTLSEPLQLLWDGTVVAVHHKDQLRPEDAGLLYTLALYYRSLYTEQEIERRAVALILEEWVRSAWYCLSSP